MERKPTEIELSRRSFLKWLTLGLGGLITAVIGGSSLAYVVSPVFKRRKEEWVDVGVAEDIPMGIPTRIEFVERRRDAWVTTERRSSAWVVTSNGQDFVVFDPRCTHLGCPYRWDDRENLFLCPCHTAAFSITGGVVSGPPPRPLDRYRAKVVGGRLLILPKALPEGKA